MRDKSNCKPEKSNHKPLRQKFLRKKIPKTPQKLAPPVKKCFLCLPKTDCLRHGDGIMGNSLLLFVRNADGDCLKTSKKTFLTTNKMALIKCKECGHEMSDQAKQCPHCGCPTEYHRKRSFSVYIFFAIIVLGILPMVLVNFNKGDNETKMLVAWLCIASIIVLLITYFTVIVKKSGWKPIWNLRWLGIGTLFLGISICLYIYTYYTTYYTYYTYCINQFLSIENAGTLMIVAKITSLFSAAIAYFKGFCAKWGNVTKWISNGLIVMTAFLLAGSFYLAYDYEKKYIVDFNKVTEEYCRQLKMLEGRTLLFNDGTNTYQVNVGEGINCKTHLKGHLDYPGASLAVTVNGEKESNVVLKGTTLYDENDKICLELHMQKSEHYSYYFDLDQNLAYYQNYKVGKVYFTFEIK